MTDIPIWPGSSSFATGSTPFGYYDGEADFQTDADNVAEWCAKRLGYPLMDVELQAASFYACFEESVMEYSNHVDQYNAQNNIHLKIGGNDRIQYSEINSVGRQWVFKYTLALAKEQLGYIRGKYGSIPIPNGETTLNSADLISAATTEKQALIEDLKRIVDVFIRSKILMTNFPNWPGSSSFVTGSTPFGYYDNEVDFQEDADDVADWCARELGYPIQSVELQASSFYAFFEQSVLEYSNQVDQYNLENNIHLTTGSNSRIQYSEINNVGRQWIRKYTLAIAKEKLGYIRGKFGSMPIGNSEASLNAADLVSAGTTEKQTLIEELKRIVDIFIRSKVLMINYPNWPGSSSFVTGSTPFGYYDNEVDFQEDADDVADWCARELGYPQQSVELNASALYAFFEQSVLEYSNNVDQYNLENNIHDVTGSNSRIQYTDINNVGRQWVRKYTLALAKEKLGYIRGKFGSMPIGASEATLNAADLISAATTEKQALLEELKRIIDIMIRTRILMKNYPNWTGTSTFTTGSTPFGYFDNDVDFQEDADDVADWCARELGYPQQSVELQSGSFYAYFEQSVLEYSNFIDQYNFEKNIQNITGSSERIQYNEINSIGRQWIFKYTLALAKEKLGYIRGKFGSIPIGNGETTLNSADLLSGAGADKQALMEDLKKIIDVSIRSRLLMMNFPNWNGSSTFTTGSTPFGYFDNDTDFQQDADDVADWCARELGYPVQTVELQSGSFYAFFEQSVLEYANYVDQYNFENNIHDVTGSSSRIQYTDINNVGRQWIRKYTLALSKEKLGYIRGKYGSMPIGGSEVTLNSADLISAATTEKQALTEELKRIVDIFIRSKILMTNFPVWTGTSTFTTGSTPFGYYDNEMDFQEDADDVADWCARELGYPLQSVEINASSFYALFEQSVLEYSNYVDQYNLENNIHNVTGSNSRIPYTDINNVGRQWIRKYTLANAKEKLGYIRGKYGSMPIGNAEATLNAADLISAGTTEKQALLEELKRLVDIMIRSKILMKNFPSWTGSSTFTTGSTPFGYYDSESDFQEDADNVADWCARELGYPQQSVELQASTFYACFEQSVLEYSNYVDQYNLQNNIHLTTGSIDRIQYSEINNVGRQWVRKYTLALAKEKLAYVRGKYGSMPIGALEATLNSADLLSAATTEKQTLIEELKRLVDIFIRSKVLMINYPNWPGSSSFVTGSTPFGYYDNDTDFQEDADDVADWCARELGYPQQSVELNAPALYAFFEQSVLEYSNQVDQYNLENNIHDVTGSIDRIQYTEINNIGRQWIRKYTLALAKEKLGYIRGKFGSMPIGALEATLNSADLISAGTAEKQSLMEELKRIVDLFIRSRILMKNFPSWTGTSTFTTGSTPFGYFDNDTDFQEDADSVADWCARELGYPQQSVELNATSLYAFFEQSVLEYSNQVDQYNVQNNVHLVSGSDGRMQYTDINNVGRQWIRKYTLALAKEKLGYIRGKFGSMPIGMAEATLNAADLISAATTEKQSLMEELKRIVDVFIRSKLLMTNFPIWPGSSSFATGSTPFGTFDTDSSFQQDADKVAKWCAKRLGYPQVTVELKAENFYACFEEAVYEYSYNVNQFNIQQNLLSLIGTPTGSNLTHRNISTNMGGLIQLATEYGSETFTNGNVKFYSSSIDIQSGKQRYDLDALIRDIKVPSGSIEIKKVHHYGPPASIRFYDPYLGNQAMLDTFGFGAYSTGVSFMLMPMYADLLRIQAIEFNDLMRKSAFTFELIDNELRMFPVPTKNFKLWIEYIVKEERSNPLKYPNGMVSDMSNAPYEVMQYSHINSPGRAWIYNYTLALVKEMLGYIRGKYGSMPIGTGEATLNSADLISSATADKQMLVEQLRTMLDTMTRSKLLEAKKVETEALGATLNATPISIYIG